MFYLNLVFVDPFLCFSNILDTIKTQDVGSEVTIGNIVKNGDFWDFC